MKTLNSMQKNIQYININNIDLALHSWIPKGEIKAILFYFHGIQSHAGWLADSALQLTSSSIAVFVLDRRGSGISEGLKGDIPSIDTLFNDYLQALKIIKVAYPDKSLTLFGHCLGGSILAGLLCWPEFNVPYNNTIFCSSDLGRLHKILTPIEQNILSNSQSLSLQPVNLLDTDFTDDPVYLEFMQNDPLCCRKITVRTRANLLKVERLYYNEKNIIKPPSAYVYSKIDPVINIPGSLSVFEKLTGGKGVNLQLPTNKHYLWFTDQKYALSHWVSNYILTNGYTSSC